MNKRKNRGIILGIVALSLGITFSLIAIGNSEKKSPVQDRRYRFDFSTKQTQAMINALRKLSIDEGEDVYSTAMFQIQQQDAAVQQAQQKPKDTLTKKKP